MKRNFEEAKKDILKEIFNSKKGYITNSHKDKSWINVKQDIMNFIFGFGEIEEEEEEEEKNSPLSTFVKIRTFEDKAICQVKFYSTLFTANVKFETHIKYLEKPFVSKYSFNRNGITNLTYEEFYNYIKNVLKAFKEEGESLIKQIKVSLRKHTVFRPLIINYILKVVFPNLFREFLFSTKQINIFGLNYMQILEEINKYLDNIMEKEGLK